MSERFKLNAYVAIILRKDEKILLIRRAQTGSFDGYYSCVGGSIDGNEPATLAAVREAGEEIGIILKKENLKIVHVLHRKEAHCDGETVGFFIEAIEWEGQPQNMEPHKHDDIGWFPIDNLPQNTALPLLHVLGMLNKNIFYSEYGW